jgi:hypothetical protein
MTDKSFPITPPPELAQTIWRELRNAHYQGSSEPEPWDRAVAKAYRAGADAELDACCEVLRGELKVLRSEFNYSFLVAPLRAARRPKPLSEADQALNDLGQLLDIAKSNGVFNPPDTIRRALERLKELESAND